MTIDYINIPLVRIRVRARQRPPGYYDEVVGQGVILPDGKTLRLPYTAHQALIAKYREAPAHTCETPACPRCANRTLIPPVEVAPPHPTNDKAEIQQFRKLFLGPLEQVPPHLAHLRSLMDLRKEEAKGSGCTGCEVGKITSEFLTHARNVQRRITARR